MPTPPIDQSPLRHLPHQPPFRFLTTLLRLAPGDHASATWAVHGDESFFTGHFPGHPIVPGVLLGEALAQLSGLVMGPSSTQPFAPPSLARLAHIDLKLLAPVTPPAEIALESRLARTIDRLTLFEVMAAVGGAPVATGRLTLTT